MWKVLRRYQGEPYKREDVLLPDPANNYHPNTSAAADPVAYNIRCIVQHECKPQPKPQDPMNLTTPHGRLVYQKLITNVTHEVVTMRRRALAMLLELYIQKGEHVVLSLQHADTVRTLVDKALVDPDDEVRTQTCIALEAIAQQPVGLTAILSGGFLPKIVAAIDDTCNDVVMEALRVLCATHAVHNDYAGTIALIRLGCIEKYVKKSRDADDAVSCMAFAAMSKVFDVKEAFIAVLENGGIEAVTAALRDRRDSLVLVEACEVAGKLAYYSAGKRAAVQHETVKAVLPLVSHEDVAVRTAAAGALVALTIVENGKLQAIDAGVVNVLHTAVDSEVERDVLQSVAKTMCNVAEHPVARLQLHACIPRLEELASVAKDFPMLQNAVNKAIACIRWRPGDAPM